MNFIEFLGFIISLVAMLFLFVRKMREEGRRRAHPEEFQKEHEDEERAVQELLDSLNIHLEPSPKKVVKTAPKVKLEKKPQVRHVEHPPEVKTPILGQYHSIQKTPPSQGYRLIRQARSPQDMIILHEILGTPKGLQP